jgi:putative addiction module component (TIGR02574 family)
MATPVSLDEIRRLSVAERILLVEDIWDTIADDTAVEVLNESERRELDARLARYKQGTSAGTDWEDIKARLVFHAKRDPKGWQDRH